MDNKKYTVFAIRCSENGRIFIGSSLNVRYYVSGIFSYLRHGNEKKAQPRMREDYSKYGEAAFEAYILEEQVPGDALRERLLYWTDRYDSLNPDHGYNVIVERPGPRRVFKDGLPPLPEGGDETDAKN